MSFLCLLSVFPFRLECLHPRLVGLLYGFTLISRVAAPTLTRFCSLMIMRTSPSGDLVRLSFAPPPIHLFMAWRVASLHYLLGTEGFHCLGGLLDIPGALLVPGGSS